MSGDRIEDLVQAYLMGEAGAEELEELKRILEAGGGDSKRAAKMLADGGMIAGWFRAEGDDRFVAEAMAAAMTDRDDPAFVGKTIERISRASSRRRLWGRREGTGPSPIIPILAAAGIMAGLAGLIVVVSTGRQRPGPVPGAVAERHVEAVETAITPEFGVEDGRKGEDRAPDRPEGAVGGNETEATRMRREEEPTRRVNAGRTDERKGGHPERRLERVEDVERTARGPSDRWGEPGSTSTDAAGPRLIAAVVDRIQGEAFVLSESGKSPARPGLTLYGGEGLETAGARGSAVIRFADGTRLEVSGDSTVKRLWERREGAPKSLLLARGTLTADVVRQPAGASMVFTSPHAEAVVLGTRLVLAVSGQTTRLDVCEGKVRIRRLPGGVPVDVPAGFFAVVNQGQEAELMHEKSIEISFQDDASPVSRYTGTRDCHFGEHKQEANRNNGRGAQVWVDGDCRPPQGDDRYALIKWDVSMIPSRSTVLSAAISINVINDSFGHPFFLYEMKRDWVEGQATWNLAASKRPWQAPGARGAQERGTVILGALAPKVNGPYTAPLNPAGVAVLQSWVNNPASNNGFWLGNPDNGDALGFDSRESQHPANRPKLTVVFVPKGR